METQRHPRKVVAYYMIHRLCNMTTSKIGALSQVDTADQDTNTFNRIVARAKAAESKQMLED